MQIRDASLSDAEAINRLSGDMGYDVVSPEVAAQRVGDILRSDGDRLWVAEAEGDVAGWIHLFVARRAESSSFAEIGGLVVSSRCRRQGTGKGLVEHAVQWAEERGLRVRVRCSAKRTETHEFYRALGFEVTKTQLVFDVED